MNQPNPAFMQNYFGQAVTLEKHIFVLRESMKKANSEMQIIYDEKAKAENNAVAYSEKLSTIDQRYEEKAIKRASDKEEDKETSEVCGKRAKKMLTFTILAAVVCGIFSFIAIVSLIFNGEPNPISLVLAGFSYYAVIPFVILFIINKVRSSRAKSRLAESQNDLATEKEAEHQLLVSNINESNNRYAELELSSAALTKTQDTISQSYRLATNALSKLYAKNLIDPKYHNFKAMASFYQYLSTGRCISIFGPGGVIDTYEKDCQFQTINDRLMNIEDYVADSNEKIGYLCEQASYANRQLERMNSSLNSIKISSAASAANTAQIANYCSSINESVRNIESSIR